MPTEADLANFLRANSRAVAHLRSQVRKKRFGLVLGAGISADFNVPGWSDLVAAIAADTSVDGTALLSGEAKNRSWPYKTELLFQRFRRRKLGADADSSDIVQENSIAADWLVLCQRCIYDGAKQEIELALREHPYLDAMLPLIRASLLTVTYNFDDFLERALALRKREQDKSSRGFEAVTDPWPQFRRTDSVIYHVHGYVPKGLMEGTVDRFVFSEASYSKQYVGARGHDSAFMTAHFARNTCLLVGCSLEDELRNVLMRGAQINPGNYHYYIHFIPDGRTISAEEREHIEETNFKVYNLLTIFASSAQIACLFRLIDPEAVSEPDLRDLAAETSTPQQFTYYMTGAIGVGKSTTANLLRSLTVLDEWLERRLDILGKPWDELTPGEKSIADGWIADQFKKKNDALRHQDSMSIRVVDRPPLDPLAFTPPAEREAKAAALLQTICHGSAYPVQEGVVILLLGIPEELSARVRATGRADYTPEKLEKMQQTMKDLYQATPGVVTIDTRYLTIPEVTKRVAQVIHREEYKPVNLMGVLSAHASPAA